MTIPEWHIRAGFESRCAFVSQQSPKIWKGRLLVFTNKAAVSRPDSLSPKRYGFKSSRSTLEAIEDVVKSAEDAQKGWISEKSLRLLRDLVDLSCLL
ncbi:unnamed protein product [Ceratitis capitata]|uniref:(Mediterranean fruit fly) hypothetical protein n=1 Tax=Ceratitis capitata TaxID=7213 RepID=A0A811UP22_CERCA|nr:unnamed protein product [Ceratitis capitata]